ncbi:hypothetical protein T552_02634 [Pneumocystis carinii B80]|uniref:FFD box profile domain-containing protein n=1 Tax=Pneumocystis carinii (strain B80) TaxID=1408658 RepID=A0A0W4ZE09_PNEC8|nr:hypothetical protein T552_02634 [Pneumocystis carinii B80]KTW26625.1 hypothetical protein T552_02634 [Pneumocystis carinii B80]
MEYLNSKISLISQSGIRYIGILHDINSKDSTISLKNVRSYGTEGRKGNPREEIPASENIFEYIVFRGSDVKDLRIEEPAPPKSVPQMPNDPAILRITEPQLHQSQQGYSFSNQTYQNIPKYSSYQGYNTSPNLQIGASPAYYDNVSGISEHSVNQNHSSKQSLHIPLTQVPSSITSDPRLCSLSMAQNKTEADPNHSSTKISKSEPITLAMPLPTRAKAPVAHQTSVKQNGATNLKNTASPVSLSKGQSSTVSTANSETHPDIQNITTEMSKLSTKRTEPRNFRLHNSGNYLMQQRHGRRRNNDHGYLQNFSNTVEAPEEEFNFTLWNAKFKKDVLKSSNKQDTDDSNNSSIPSKENYYDSRKSFFDNISCENKERIENKEKGNSRIRRDQERSQNMETFGQARLQTKKQGKGRGRGGFYGGYQGHKYKNGNKNQRTVNGESVQQIQT